MRRTVALPCLVAAVLLELSTAQAAKAPPRAAAKKAEAAPAKTPSPVAAVPTAPKPSSYEELLQGADHPQDLGELIEPMFAKCATDSDLAYRQCEEIREFLLDRMKGRSFRVTADPAALQSSPWDKTEKSLTLTVTGCISCLKPPDVDGAPRLIATRPPKGFSDGAPIGIDIGFHEVAIPDETHAERFENKVLPRLRVEYVFQVGQPFDAGQLHGVTVVPIGHRVYNSCTGEVLASDPVSKGPATIAARDPSCPAADAPTDDELAARAEQAKLPETLSRDDIERAMAAAQKDIDECASVLELRGVAKVSLVLRGDGKNEMKVAPPFNSGEGGICIRKALRKVTFPRFKDGHTIPVDYPFVLHP